MNKSAIIKELAKKEGLSIAITKSVVNQFFKLIANGLKKENKVNLKGIGKFYLVNSVNNSKQQKPKKKIRFKAGTEYSSTVN